MPAADRDTVVHIDIGHTGTAMLESAASAVRADSHGPTSSEPTAVHLVTLGCARNEVDSEELAAQLDSGGFRPIQLKLMR